MDFRGVFLILATITKKCSMETFILLQNPKKKSAIKTFLGKKLKKYFRLLESTKSDVFQFVKNYLLNCVFGVACVWFILLHFDYFTFFWSYIAQFSFKKKTKKFNFYVFVIFLFKKKYRPQHFF